jgi:hypothetical protein
MADGSLVRFFWRIVDDLDHLLMLARLRITDMVSTPGRDTPAEQRHADRERQALGSGHVLETAPDSRQRDDQDPNSV